MVALAPVPPFAAWVDRVGDDENVILDLNDGVLFKTLAGFNVPPPPLATIVSEGVLRDGAEVPASAYGLNTVTIPLAIEAATQDAAEDAVQVLARILNVGGILRWQETSTPVYMLAERSPVYERDVRLWLEYRRIVMNLTVQPFLLGQPIDLSVPDVPNNPAAVAVAAGTSSDPAVAIERSGQRITVAGLPGVVPSPVVMTLGGTGETFARYVIGCRHGAALREPFQVEGSVPAGAVLQANSATASGAGQNYVRATGASVDLAVPEDAVQGANRLYVRVRIDGADGATVTGVDGVVRAVPQIAPGWQYVYAGLLVSGERVAERYGYGAPPAQVQAYTQTVTLNRGSSVFIDADVVVYVPADVAVTVVDAFVQTPATDVLVIDGPNDTAYSAVLGVTPSAPLQIAYPFDVDLRYGTPLLAPQTTNHVRLIASNYDTGDDVTDTTDVTFRVYPRYLTPP